MKLFTIILAGLALAASAAETGVIDGTWVYQRTDEKNGQTLKMSQAFNLKATGNKLTGTIVITINGNVKPPIEILEGKVEGKKFSFYTFTRTNKGNFKSSYEGAVEAGALKGTISSDGKNAPFSAQKNQ